tara:strand:+ start:13111 stop:14523 length:1413 start_codon:yes stop_codon:yes gene_type:complete
MLHLNSSENRIEKDLLGHMEVANSVYYGIQTQRAIDNFQLSRNKLCNYPELIKALALVKAACAKANNKQKLLDDKKYDAIIFATQAIIDGEFDKYFSVDMIQGGAGTSCNMNMNEVIANVGLEYMGLKKGQYSFLHPNSHVNMSQSTNDVYPTAIRLAIHLKQTHLLDALSSLVNAFGEKSHEFKDIQKLARTQLQDAVPMTLGQEFNSFSSTLRQEVTLLNSMSELLMSINLGGTAVGTGITTKQGYSKLAIKALADLTSIEFKPVDDFFDASSDMGALVTYSSALKRLALKLSKISNDLRLLSMGPRGGISEIKLPNRQPGSSIMPGKVNPVIPEAVSQCAYQVVGFDLAISMAAEAGQLQLNAMEPLIAVNLLESMNLLTNAIVMLKTLCVDDIEANESRCRDNLNNSLAMVTALNPVLGYEVCTQITKEALQNGGSIIEQVIGKKLLTRQQLHSILNTNNIVQPTP